MKRNLICVLVWGALLATLLLNVTVTAGHAKQGADPFPRYPEIEPNILFWKKVYSEFTTSQGIIHDSRNLDIIYEVVALDPPSKSGSQRSNQRKIKTVKKKYKAILKKLARGIKPDTKTEERIYQLFQENGRALKNAWKNVRFQLGQKDRFIRGVIRSGAYLEEIKKIIGRHGLPEELAYLPHVESSFNYKAYSKFGAAGIWQFTRGTGKRYLKMDYTLDERRDPILATHAAAKHLKNNHEKLGSWPFAITAYNHGVNGILKAKNKIGGDYAAVFKKYNGRLFGFASRNFYSEFLAAVEVAENYQTYFGELDIDPPVRRKEVLLSGYVAVSDVAEHFDIEEQEIQVLNPALRKPVFLGQKFIPKGYRLYLPETNGNSEKLIGRLPKDLLYPRQKPSRFYRVQQGDTAGNIARREGVRLKDLIVANQLDRKATIYVGQHLRIPTPEEKLLLASATVATGQDQAAPVPEHKSRPTVPQKPESPLPAAGKDKPAVSGSEVLVASRETAAPVQLPQAEIVPPEELEPEDAPVSDKEKPFMETELSPSGASDEILEVVNPAILTGHLEVERVAGEGRNQYGIIRVEAEETLGHYADWLELPTWKLRRLNKLRFGKSIHIDQKLKIPLRKVAKEQFEEKRYEYHKGIEEDFFSAYRVEKLGDYKVQKGDSIWRLCLDTFELPLWIIKKYNPSVDLYNLRQAVILKVPIVKKREE